MSKIDALSNLPTDTLRLLIKEGKKLEIGPDKPVGREGGSLVLVLKGNLSYADGRSVQ